MSKDRWRSYQDLVFQCFDSDQNEWYISADKKIVLHDVRSNNWKQFTTEQGVISHPNKIFASSKGSIWASGSHHQIAAVSVLTTKGWKIHQHHQLGDLISHLSVSEGKSGDLYFGCGDAGLRQKAQAGGIVRYKNGVFSDYEYLVRPRNFREESLEFKRQVMIVF